MKRVFHWLDENLEEFLLVIGLIAMTLIMGIQVFCRYVLGMSLSWSEELTRYIFIWCGFLSVSYCSKKCLSIKIEQFVAIFPRRGKAIFKIVNHTFELIFFIYMIPFAFSYMMSSVKSGQLSPACFHQCPGQNTHHVIQVPIRRDGDGHPVPCPLHSAAGNGPHCVTMGGHAGA